MKNMSEHEYAVAQAYAADENFANVLRRFSRAQQNGENLKDALNAYDETDVENYERITVSIDQIRKEFNALCARLHCVCDKRAYSSLPYVEIKEMLKRSQRQLEKLLQENISPSIYDQNERYYLD